MGDQKPKISSKKFISYVMSCLSSNINKDLLLIFDFYENLKNHKYTIYVPSKNKNSMFKNKLIFIMKNTKSIFLRKWAKCTLNLEEIIIGIICKYQKYSIEETKNHLSKYPNEITNLIIKNYEFSNLELQKKYQWVNKIQKL